MARIIWKENSLVNIKLREDLFTIGQLLRSPFIRFYKIQSSDGCWKNVDLNNIEPLFTVMIGNVVFQKLVTEKIKEKTVIFSNLPFEKYWIDAHLNFEGGYPFKGGKLIELDPNIGTTQAPIIKEDLDFIKDREIIDKYELTNMWGAEDLAERLTYFFDTGKDHNSHKEKIFPGLYEENISKKDFFIKSIEEKTTLEELKKEKPTEKWKQDMEDGDEHYSAEIIEQSEKALDLFIDNLIRLGNKSSEQKVLECVRDIVMRFNELDESYFFIETIEREELCEFIDKAVLLAGLKIEGDVTEEWRNW